MENFLTNLMDIQQQLNDSKQLKEFQEIADQGYETWSTVESIRETNKQMDAQLETLDKKLNQLLDLIENIILE